MALAWADGLVTTEVAVFDYGCGRGDDLRTLHQLGVAAHGWDPNHRPDGPKLVADVVNLGYVINVIEDVRERRQVLRDAWDYAKEVLIVAARPIWEAKAVKGRSHGDGILTAKDTFQKFYEQDELRTFIETAVGQRAVAAAPGVFYVFRQEHSAQAFLARRSRRSAEGGLRIGEMLFDTYREPLGALREFVESQRRLPGPQELDPPTEAKLVAELGSIRSAFALLRRVTGPDQWTDIDLGRSNQTERRFDANREVLEPLMTFVEERGRLPRSEEFADSSQLAEAFGSIRAAFSLVRRVTGPDRWTVVEDQARQNFLVYLALSAFGGRPRFSDLPNDLQLDVRDLFGNYKAAVAEADRLLFAAGDMASISGAATRSAVGKMTPEALYVHVSALPQLPPLLRVYEGCGQALAGTVEGATVVKLHREKPQVSYLSYPSFDEEPHPVLDSVVIARLRALNLTYRDFSASDNPPILHRKETFVGPSYPNREKFTRLSAQEERFGLLSSPSIGTREGWNQRLTEAGVRLNGHRVVRVRTGH